MLRPSTWTSSVACPTQVMLGGGGIAAQRGPVVGDAGGLEGARRGQAVPQPAATMKLQRVQADGRMKAGSRFRNPPAT